MTAITTNDTTTVAVRGFAELEVPPDYATIAFNVEATADDADDALESAGEDAEACRAALDAATGVRKSGLSRVRVRELSHWDKKKDIHVSDGFSATLSGSVEIDTAHVGELVTRLVTAGARISWVGWDIDADNAAYREARKIAVTDAHRAATDFADAVCASLGSLATLADPGLLEAGRREHTDGVNADFSVASYSMPQERTELELDPELQQVRAHVEACFFLV